MTKSILSSETLRFIAAHHSEDSRQLALKYSRQVPENVDLSQALIQIEGRQLARTKLPDWYAKDGILYPPKLAMEQCSSQLTAQYKATLWEGNTLVDLTGGFGVDFSFLAPAFREAIYIEQQPHLVETAKHNATILGLSHAEFISQDSVAYLEEMEAVDCLFIDPARRSDSGKKVFTIESCEPNLEAIQDRLLQKAETVLIKLSPMLDITQALNTLRCVREVHIVSVENECKELLFLLKRETENAPCIFCVNLSRRHTPSVIHFEAEEEKRAIPDYTTEPKQFLYEPNTSIMKSGFFKSIAVRYHLQKFHPDSHLYTSDRLIPDFPGRTFRIETYSTLNKKELNSLLRGIDNANLTVRNFPMSVEALRKKLKLKEGGDIYLFATTLYNEQKVLIKGRRLQEI